MSLAASPAAQQQLYMSDTLKRAVLAILAALAGALALEDYPPGYSPIAGKRWHLTIGETIVWGAAPTILDVK